MSVTLRSEKRKTWQRVIRPNTQNILTEYRGKLTRVKEIIYSVILEECFLKRHKMSIRTKPFPRALVQEFI